MGWFRRKKKNICDWCGVKFTDEGVTTEEGWLFCSETCR